MVAGCAARPAPGPPAPVAVSLAYGTIVSMRPAVLAAGQAVDLTGATGDVTESDRQNFALGRMIEFIVLQDGASQPVSVVQGNEYQFRPGDRVLLTRDGRTRLRRAGA